MSGRVIEGDSLAVMASLADNSIASVVTDPPYGLKFMGKAWDHGVPGVPYWQEALRVLAPGGYLVAFGGTRTYHRLTCAIEDAGFEIRDCLNWLYGCLSDDTEILIDGQWEPYHRATIGRLALCYNATDDTYSWQPIQDTFRYDICDTAYRIQSDRTDQVVSRNHRCLIERGGAYLFERAEEVARERQARVPVLEDLPGLLAALPVPHEGASSAQQSMRTGMRREAHRGATEAVAALGTTGHGLRDLFGVRQASLEAPGLGEASRTADVLVSLQRRTARAGVEAACAQGARCLDCLQRSKTPGEDERRTESRLEGRGNVQAEQGQLHRAEVRQVPGGVLGDGSQGRLRHGAPTRGGASHWALSDEDRVGSPCRSQHQEQRPLQSDAVCDEPGPQVVRGARYTSADLATVEPFHYDGVVWCVRVPTGAFVARRNGKVFVTGNSGFPKGQACLKPGWEPIVLARKPGRSAPLNIDACRLSTAEMAAPRSDRPRDGAPEWRMPGGGSGSGATSPLGRWPANVVLSHDAACVEVGTVEIPSRGGAIRTNHPGRLNDDGWQDTPYPIKRPDPTVAVFDCTPTCAVRLLDEQSGTLSSNSGKPFKRGTDKTRHTFGAFPGDLNEPGYYGDTGGASRFFYCAKASPSERGAFNDHPTVKPLALMRWLIRLVTPTGGTVLDTFAGSGSTLVAAAHEGFDSIGIDSDPHAVEIARRRLADVIGPLFSGAAS